MRDTHEPPDWWLTALYIGLVLAAAIAALVQALRD